MKAIVETVFQALSRGLPTLLFLAGLSAASRGQSIFEPVAPEHRVNASTSFSQYWVRVAIAPTTGVRGYCFSNGQNTQARFFDDQGGAITGNKACNSLYTTGIQDEGEIGWSVEGRFLVAWSERSGADGEQMGIFGRIFGPNGQAIAGSEFQINQAWQASQWRPLIATHPWGGWVVAWSTDWDGDAVYRIVAGDGTFVTGDIPIDTFGFGAQVDTAPAVAPDGTTFMCFVDYSGAGGLGSGTNLWYRLFDGAGIPIFPTEVAVTPPANAAFDQREPRVAVDGLGRFIVVWENARSAIPTDPWDVHARIFGPGGAPVSPVFQVNSTTLGKKQWTGPRVAADASGSFVVTWVDWTGGGADVVARRFDPSGTPHGPEFVVSSSTAGNQELPSVAVDGSGEHWTFCFEGPLVQRDVFARTFRTYRPPTPYCTAGVSSSGCQALLSGTGTPSASATSGFQLTASGAEGEKYGLFFFAANGRQANPWGNGSSFQCVTPPVLRAGLITGTGTAGACDGGFSQDLNELWCSTCPKPQKNPGVGALVQTQLWYRDPGNTSNQTTSLSNALEFTVRP